jgi:hypothetical protein
MRENNLNDFLVSLSLSLGIREIKLNYITLKRINLF